MKILKLLTKIIVFGLLSVPVVLAIFEKNILRINGIGHYLTLLIIATCLTISRKIVGEKEYGKMVESDRLVFDVMSMEWENRFRPID